MSKKTRPGSEPDLRAEYEFGEGVRGKYSERFAQGSNVVVLDPDVVEVFGDAEAVNAALRLLARSARDSR